MAWIIAGGAIAGGLISAIGSSKAASKQASSGDAAIDEMRREFDINQAALAPYRAAGQTALNTLMSDLGPGGSLSKPFNFDITQDPGYQFRLDQGMKGVTNSAAASGMNLSGATLKELQKFGSDYASGEFNAAFSRDLATKNQTFSELTGVAGLGIGATQTGVSAGTATSANIGNTMTGIGNAQAAGIVGGANAIGGAVGNIGNTFLLSQILNQNKGGGGSSGLPLPGSIDNVDG